MRGRGRGSGESGAAALLGVQLIALLGVFAVALAGVGALVVAHRRAQSAADLAALAGAAAVQEGRPSCPAAAAVATRNRGRLTRCRAAGEIVTVEVAVRTPALPGTPGTTTARARAGPATVGVPGIGPPVLRGAGGGP